jgi:N-acetylglucosaminyl-diphospho-decaprenol L-rhamnosyltransferase
MPTLPVVSVLVVNFNTRALTLACLDSILGETKVGFEVIVVDNASSDGSTDAIAGKFPNVTLIRSEKNIGFGPANNLAGKQAKGEYVLLLNSDTVVLDAAVDRLITFARTHPEAMIWGGRTLFADGTLNPTSCWRHMSLWSLFCHSLGLTSLLRSVDFFNREGYGGWKRDTEREVGFVSGCFLMIRRQLWDQLGGFDERFFMYAEETDLCQRATVFGARPMITPKATIVHYGGKSEKVREDKLVRLFAGRMTFVLKHWTPAMATAARYLMLLHCAVRASAEMLRAAMRHGQPGAREKPWSGVLKRRANWENGYPLL